MTVMLLILAICYMVALISATLDTGLIDLGDKTGTEAHSACPTNSDLPVIRTEAELDRIQAVIGTTSK